MSDGIPVDPIGLSNEHSLCSGRNYEVGRLGSLEPAVRANIRLFQPQSVGAPKQRWSEHVWREGTASKEVPNDIYGVLVAYSVVV